MKKDFEFIQQLLEKEADYFENIIDDYENSFHSDQKPDGKWFEDLLLRRKRHIDQMTIIFNSEKTRQTIKEKMPRVLKKRFQKIFGSILSMDAAMVQRLEDIKTEQTKLLGKFNNFHKFIRQNAENVSKPRVVDLSIK